MSAEFSQFLVWCSIGAWVGGVVAAVFYLMKRGRGKKSGYNDPEDMAMWVKPVIVFAGVLSVWGDLVSGINGVLLFAVAFCVGLVCAITSYFEQALRIRDTVLAVIAGITVGVIVVIRLASGAETMVIYLVLLAALAAGIALGGLKRILEPVTWIAVLGGLEILDYLFSPFGPASFSGFDAWTLVIGVTGAIVMGVLIRIAPDLVVILAGVSIVILGLLVQVLLWFESQNYPAGTVQPDWTMAIAMGGIALGYGVKSMPDVLLDRWVRRRT